MASHDLSHYQASAALHDPFMPLKPVTLTYYQVQLPAQDKTLATSETYLPCDLRNNFPEDFTTVMLVPS